ncbi:hypothetical protein AAKU67_003711 [Oxalobacteraceae bacterium GrIS 2.11]
MKKKTDKQHEAAHVAPSTAPADVKNLKEKAEQNEVAGRHKNDGQIGHKGAR